MCTFCGKNPNKVYPIEIGTIQTVFVRERYRSVAHPSKQAFATKSEPWRLIITIIGSQPANLNAYILCVSRFPRARANLVHRARSRSLPATIAGGGQ